MRACTDLCKLHDASLRKLKQLGGLAAGIYPPVDAVADRSVAFVVIEAVNVWTLFCRAFYLSCVLGTRTVGRRRVKSASAAIRSKGAALTYAVRTMNPKKTGTGPWTWRDEPIWRQPLTILTLSQNLGFSNLGAVQAAFGYQTDVYSVMPKFRNYFAHRGEGARLDVEQTAVRLGLSRGLRPADMLSSKRRARPQSVLSDWLTDLENVVDLICQ
jgi:hypothetical protein